MEKRTEINFKVGVALIFLVSIIGLIIWTFIYHYIIALIIIASLFSLQGIAYLLERYTKILDAKCKVCKQKRKWFFGAWETNLEYDAKTEAYVKFPHIEANDTICVQCCKEHKLFDNY